MDAIASNTNDIIELIEFRKIARVRRPENGENTTPISYTRTRELLDRALNPIKTLTL